MLKIEVKKHKSREFLVFCAAMAIANEKLRDELWKDVIERKVVVLSKDRGVVPRKVKSFEPLICNVIQMAKLFTAKKEFWFQVIPPSETFAIQIDDEWSGVRQLVYNQEDAGLVRYIDGPCNVLKGPLPSRETSSLKECAYDPLTQAFLDTIEIYADRKNLYYFDIPLRLCEWCGRVFFGKRLDQRFCCQEHGQRWRSREAYKVKKMAKAKSAQ